MLLSAVSVLVVAQSSSKIPEGLMNNSVYTLYIMPLTFFIHLPMKMELIRSSETSAIKTQ